MLWTPEKQYATEPFETESQLESAIAQVAATLFGPNRVYLDVKRLIDSKGKTKNIPDGYRSVSTSAITHVAQVRDIALWKDGPKYVVNFSEPAKQIGPLNLVPRPNGTVKVPQAPRYTSYTRLMKATNLDEAF